MEEILRSMVGKDVTIFTHPQFSVKGKVIACVNGVLTYQSQNKTWYIPVHAITAAVPEGKEIVPT